MKKITLIILSLVLLMSAVCCSSNPVEPPEVSVKAVIDFSKVKLMKGDKIYFTAEWQFKGKTMCHEVDFTVEDTGIKTREVPFKPRKVAGIMKVSVFRPFDTVTKDTSEGYEVAMSYSEVEFSEGGLYQMEVEPVDDYLTFTGTNVIVTPNGWKGLKGAKLEYSVDGGDWTKISNGTPTPKASVVKFRGTNGIVGSGGSTWKIVGSNVSVSGNIMTVLDWENPSTTIPVDDCFSKMFYEQSSLIDASGLSLPSTTLAESCYSHMFYGCFNLTTAPSLPATTLAEECYSHMFDYCYGLTTAPELPATTLAEYCYYYMFSECTKLTTGPSLPATTLAKHCYEGMFYGCSALKNAPVLPATTLAESCYSNMFNNCQELTTAPELPATTLAKSCYSNMFCGCKILATAPDLPATTLAESCYSNMFNNCQELTTAPELPATTLAKSCYSKMFSVCSKLTVAPKLPAITLTDFCYYYMFSYCYGLTTAPTLPATTLADECYSGMFYYCSALTTAPELPATALTNSCYYYMFAFCSKLTTAPELPAATLANYCYYSMFYECKSLKISTTGENSQKIFTCPSTSGFSGPVYDMFIGTGGTFTDDPCEGETYYWY